MIQRKTLVLVNHSEKVSDIVLIDMLYLLVYIVFNYYKLLFDIFAIQIIIMHELWCFQIHY